MATNVTNNDVAIQMFRVERMLKSADLHYWPGKSSMKIPNRLMVNGTNIWPDAMAGYTRREAWNALRIMAATMSLTAELRETERGTVR